MRWQFFLVLSQQLEILIKSASSDKDLAEISFVEDLRWISEIIWYRIERSVTNFNKFIAYLSNFGLLFDRMN